MYGVQREEWEIKDDARTLARAEEIKADKKRHREAVEMARKIADEEIKRVNGMLKIADRKPPKVSKDTTSVDTGFGRNRRSNPATIGKLF